jgi:chromatin segregation and condensation protein Rec8/ScpA/Scc1 (kleisin family)
VTFTELLSSEPTLGWAVVTFIALLDLYRRSVIDLEQNELFADILVRRKQAA